MFGSAVLDVAIGLVLVYLLVSILLTSVSEAIEAVLKTRATDLENALSQLFQNNDGLLTAFYRHPLIAGLYRGNYASPEATAAARKNLTLPSYIPREAFAAAIMDLAKAEGPAKEAMERAFQSLGRHAGGDAAATRRALEGWFDGAMDRASGWFKRRTQLRLFILGLGIALIGNVNSVTIGQYLALNQEARERVVQAAPQLAASTMQQDAGNASATANDAASNMAQAVDAVTAARNAAQRTGDQLQAIGLPIGWSDSVVSLTLSGFPADPMASPARMARSVLMAIILIAGYLATAFAVMLGAPFWFDMLNKLMVVRSTVKPREKSPDEPPVDGPAPPPPAPPPPVVPAAPPPPAAGQPSRSSSAQARGRKPGATGRRSSSHPRV